MNNSRTGDQQSIEKISASEDTNALNAEQGIHVRPTDDQEATPWNNTFLEEGEGSGQQYQEEVQQTQEEDNDIDERGAPDACLFVGNLNSQMTDDEQRTTLQDHFSRWGTVLNIKVCKDFMGRPYAFVQFRSTNDARRARDDTSVNLIDNRFIRVESARVNRTLAISNFESNLTAEVFKNKLQQYGTVEGVTIRPGSQARPKTSYVKYRYRDDAIAAFSDLRSKNTQSKWTVHWAATATGSMPPRGPQSRPQRQNTPTSQTDLGDTTASPAYVGANVPIQNMGAQEMADNPSNLLIREGWHTDLQGRRDYVLHSNRVSLPALNRSILPNFPHGTLRPLDSSSSHPNRQSDHNIPPGQPLQQQSQQPQQPQQPQQYILIAGQPPYMGAGYYYPLMQENYQDPYYMAYGNYPIWLPSTVYPTTYYNPWPATQSHSNLSESVSEPRVGIQNNNQEQPVQQPIQQFVQQPIQQSTQQLIQQPLQQPPPLFQQPYQQPFPYPFVQSIPHFQPIRQPNQRSNQMSRQASQQPPQNLTTTASNQSAAAVTGSVQYQHPGSRRKR